MPYRRRPAPTRGWWSGAEQSREQSRARWAGAPAGGSQKGGGSQDGERQGRRGSPAASFQVPSKHRGAAGGSGTGTRCCPWEAALVLEIQALIGVRGHGAAAENCPEGSPRRKKAGSQAGCGAPLGARGRDPISDPLAALAGAARVFLGRRGPGSVAEPLLGMPKAPGPVPRSISWGRGRPNGLSQSMAASFAP